MKNIRVKQCLALAILASMIFTFAACGAEKTAQDAEASGAGADFTEMLKGHELPLAGNPVMGSYITTSGVKMDLGEGGFYSWDERDLGGALVTGRYEIYEGTPKGNDDGSFEYVYESETGPIYTVLIDFDQSDANSAVDVAIQVFDRYSDDVFRVTDILNNIWFEATRNAAGSTGQETMLPAPEVFAVPVPDGVAIAVIWNEVAGAEGYQGKSDRAVRPNFVW